MRINRWLGTLLIMVLFTKVGLSQQLRLGNNPWTVEKSAVLELQSTNQGLLFTRIADTALINVMNPPDGMVVYFTPTKRLLLRANGYWQSMATTTSIDTSNIPNFYLKVRSELSAGTGISYNSTTGVISNTGVTSVNGNTGALTMDTGYISSFYQKVRGLFSASAPITLTNGLIGISQATTSTNGYLSSTDWNTFNNKLTSIDTTNISNFWQKVRSEHSAGAGIGYNITTGAISNTGVLSLNGNTGALTMDTGYISNFYQKVRGLFSASAPITLTNGLIGISQATTSTNGYLSSTDWNTFNNKLSSVDTTNISNFWQKVRSEHSAGTGIGYNITTGAISNTGVLSLNGNTGALTMDTTFISNFYSKVRSLFSAGTGISYNSTTGIITASGAAGSNWALNGNTVSAEKKFGTIDNYDLPFITNNTEQMRLDKTGNLGIGTSSFDGTAPEKLLIDAGNTSSYNLLVAKGSKNGYLQFNITNESAGGQASTDIVATANNGTETTNYIDLGMNGGSYNNASNILSGSNNGYLYSAGNDFIVGNSSTNKDMILFTGGIATTNERMRITSAGKVGIGTTNPSEVLDLVGNFELNGALMPGGSAGTAGYILSSNGAGSAPSWIAGATATCWALDGNSVSGVKNFGTISNHHLPFITNNVERMRITNAGKVGIGTSTPSEVLEVNGNLQLNNAFMPGGSAGTSGYYLQSAGAGAAPTWVASSATDWVLDGNSVSSIKNFGTTNNQSLPFITNSVERMRITNSGNVGIGTSTFDGSNPEKLLVNAGTTSSFNLINAKGSINNYLQLNIQNLSSGGSASSDVVATANDGDESTYFVDMGINSSGYSSSGILGGAHNAYLYSAGNDFVIGNQTAAKNLIFFTGGSAAGNERMRIDGNGNIGIATTAPASKLDVNGSAGLGITTTSANLTLDETNYSVIITGGTPVITLPAASTCGRRIYVIVNQTGGARTISSYKNFSNASTTTVAANSSITVQSDGTNWYRIQ